MEKKQKPKALMYALLFGSIICGSFFIPLFKIGITSGYNLNPENTLFYRMLLATLIVGAVCLSKANLRAEVVSIFKNRRLLFQLALLGTLRGLDLLMWSYAMLDTTSFVVNILANTSPIFIIIGAYIVYKEKTSPLSIVGVLISLVGVSVVGASGGEGGSVALGTVVYMLISALSYAVFLLVGRSIRENISALVMMFFVFMLCAPMALAACLIRGAAIWPIAGMGWLYLLGMVIMGVILSQILPIYAIKYINPLHVSMVSLTAPFIAAVTAYFTLGETLNGNALLGGIVTFAGLTVYTLSDAKAGSKGEEPAGTIAKENDT